MQYIEYFLEKCKDKPFVKNLQKYSELEFNGKAKVISSMITNLYIDAETGAKNKEYIDELISILSEFHFYKIDSFLSWIDSKIS